MRQLARHGPVISTHAPRAGSDEGVERDARRSRISTHAPRAGSDELAGVDVTGAGKFQPTLPVRGATRHNGAW